MVDRFLVVGDVIDDIVVVPHGPIRPDTDTPSSIRSVAGGSAANTAAWLGSLGASVDFVGMVGERDVVRHGSLLGGAGVSAHLSTHPTLPTGTIVLVIDGERRTMLTEKGANPALDLADVSDELLASAAVLHLTGYTLFAAEDGGASFIRLIARARDRGMVVSVDPGSAGFIADFGVGRFLAAAAGASVLFPNLEEGRLLTGLAEPFAVAAELARAFEVVAVTMGTAGVVVAQGTAAHIVPASPATVVDPTGAGDAFAAGFLECWLRTAELSASAAAGAAVAARAVSVVGGRPPVTAS